MRLAKSMIRGSLLVVAAVVLALAPAQGAAAQGSRIATIEINSVLDQLDEKSTREQELQDYLTQLEGRVQRLQTELNSKQQELELLPQGDPEYQEVAEEIIRRSISLRGEQELAQALAEKKRKEIQLDLFNKIKETAGRYASEEGVDVVLINDSKEPIPREMSAQQVQGAILSRRILWANESLDISGAVASKMNNEFKAQ